MATRTTKGSGPTQSNPTQTKPRSTAPPAAPQTGSAPPQVGEQFPGAEVPTRISPEEVATIVEAPESPTTPRLRPPELRSPDSTTEAALETATATWRTTQYVDALWSINQVRNAWILVRGLGWRKLYNGRDGACNALVMLASQARQTGRSISFREEADGMIYEIYLW